MAEHIEDQLSAYIDGALDKEECQHVQSHLQQCAACRELVQELTAMKEQILFTYEAVDPPDHLSMSIMERIQSESSRQRSAPQTNKWALGSVAAFMLVLVSVLLSPLVYFLVKLLSVVASTGLHVLHTVPVVVSSIPYFSTSVFVGAIALIVLSMWFLYHLLGTRTFDRGEIG